MRNGRDPGARGYFRAEDGVRIDQAALLGILSAFFLPPPEVLEIVLTIPRVCVSIFGGSSSNRADLMKHNHLKSLVSFPSVPAADKAGGKKLPRSALWTLSPAAPGGCNGDAI
jgi:hypothetical protein